MLRVTGKGGEKFWVPIRTEGGLPVVDVHEGAPIAGLAGEVKGTADELVFDTGGGVKISPSIVKAATEERQLKALECLHQRLGHASGRRLYLTLKEKGWWGVFMEKQCSDIKCDACRIINRRKARIPAVQDVRRSSIKPGEVAYQDLVTMPKATGGYNYISVIVDARTRQVAAMALRTKSKAILHCQRYVRRLEAAKMQVKEWRSDNGGEFANEDYKKFL